MAGVIVVMGVSGCGKSSIAEALAKKLDVDFVDGDDLHPQANIDKMASGQPLNDDDRQPWLEAISQLGKDKVAAGKTLVVVCSALKKQYRDILRNASDNMQFVFLKGSFELIHQRMQSRQNHFMKASMLESQFNTLDIQDSINDEHDILVVDITPSIEEITASLVTHFTAQGNKYV